MTGRLRPDPGAAAQTVRAGLERAAEGLVPETAGRIDSLAIRVRHGASADEVVRAFRAALARQSGGEGER